MESATHLFKNQPQSESGNLPAGENPQTSAPVKQPDSDDCRVLPIPFDGGIDYINPHATSTPVGDVKEIEAIREVFGSKCPPISATKSLTGHSLGATGVQEAIYSLLMMNNGFICESANIEELDPDFADMPIVRKRIENAKIGAVLSNSFGFGGTNATIVMKRLEA